MFIMDKVLAYNTKLTELVLARVEPGYTQDHESALVAELDNLWWGLTPEEQILAEKLPAAPESLNLVDQIACTGIPPKRATA